MIFLWVKTLHIVFVTSWFAGLFYLPRICVNIAMVDERQPALDDPERARLILMADKLYRFMGPLMVLALVFGLWLWLGYGIGSGQGWMVAKLALVVGILVFHHLCGRMLRGLRQGPGKRSHVWFRWFNEAPVLALLAVVALVVIKPF